MLAILSTTTNDQTASARLATLEKSKRDGGDAAAADRCKSQTLADTNGCGYAFETPDRTKSWDREMQKGTCHSANNGAHCVAMSRLKRTAVLNSIMQWMGLGNDMTDPNMPPPSDSQIFMAHYGKLLAKQRWSKAGSALGALRALKLTGGAGALAKLTSPPPADDSPNDSPADSPVHPSLAQRGKRMSVSFIKQDAVATNIAKKTMSKLPKSADVKKILRELEGSFAFCILDTRQEYAFCALSEEAKVDMYLSVTDDGSLFFTTEFDALPKDSQCAQMPKGTFFLGRYNGNGLDDLVFQPYTNRTPAA